MTAERARLAILATTALAAALLAAPAAAYQPFSPGARFAGDPDGPPPVDVTAIPAEARQAAGSLIVQDFQGRMQPLDTLARALVRKVTKRFDVEGYTATDLYLSWLANPQYWWEQPLIYVRHPGIKDLLGVAHDVTHVSARSLFDAAGSYRLQEQVSVAYRTPDRDRTKLQRRLLGFDERLSMVFQGVQGTLLRIFPLPGDADRTWVNGEDAVARVESGDLPRIQRAYAGFLGGLQRGAAGDFAAAVVDIEERQREHGSDVLPGPLALRSELLLNKWRPFTRVLWGYLAACAALMAAFFHSLVRRQGRGYPLRHPLYLPGLVLFALSLAAHLAAYAMRWFASGRAPLANGYESLIFISLAVAAAGLIFEFKERRGEAAGLSALLAFVIIGISMMSFFDPAIGLLVPVLNSYWLNIHVTVITASYGLLGLGALVGGLMLVLYLFKGPDRAVLHNAIKRLEGLLFPVIIYGLGLLSIGTILGGVWANESWGRYWGWDPKETWSLVTILTYAVVSHIRLIPKIKSPWTLAAGSFAGIATVIMTFYGVNYFLQGLHSYAQGGAVTVPAWVYVGAALMAGLITASYVVASKREWEAPVPSPSSNLPDPARSGVELP
jgi:cytochrome c-type biogenesis protein CcsB